MRKIGIALVLAGLMAGAAATLQAKSLYVVDHWNEKGGGFYSTLKLDLAGCLNHITNHPEDILIDAGDGLCVAE